MNHALPPVAIAALLALTACSQGEPEIVNANPDPMAAELANARPVELPPAAIADVTFRCADNSLVYVTFFAGEKLADVRVERGGTPVRLTAPEAGQPRTADDGWVLTGDPENIAVTRPGKPRTTCHT